MNKRLNTLLMIVVLMASIMLMLAGFAQAEEAQIAIRSVDTSKYPINSLTLTISGSEKLLAQILRAENFTLKENGKLVSSFEVQPVFQSPEPVAVVLALDSSGSMLGKPLEDAKAAARAFINQMGNQDQIALVAFDSKPRILSGLTTDKAALFGAIDGIKAQGETALYDGLAAATDVLASSNLTHKNLIVLSDGGDTRSMTSAEAVLQKTRSYGIPIFGIALQSSEYKPAALQSICENSGGSLFLTSDSGTLGALYLRIAKELHNQYRITYTSINPGTKNMNVVLEINALDSHAKITTAVQNPRYKAARPSAKTNEVKPNPSLPKFMSPSYILIGAVLLSFVSVSLLVFVVLSIFLSRGTSFRKQMEFYDAAWKVRRKGEQGLQRPAEKSRDEKIKEKILQGVDYLARQRGFTELVRLKLEQAGLPLRPLEFIFFHFLFVLLTGIVASLFYRNFVSIILLMGIAAALPILILSLLIGRRRTHFHEQLPETLSMIAGSIRAGYSFLQAISAAVEETLPPMSEEFQRVLTEARLGFPLEEALEKMAERVGEENFSWTVMAINIQREVGGNLAEVLDILADTIRERDRVKRQIKTLTAEGRLSALILIILPFAQAFLIFLLNPSYMSLLFTTGIGLLMVLVAAVLMLVGGMWLKKIVSIEV